MDQTKVAGGSERNTETIGTDDAGEFMSRIYESCGRALTEKAEDGPILSTSARPR